MFGVYIFLHGHLTPGGGFQGGVVIATALVLEPAGPSRIPALAHGIMAAVESLSGAAYVALGLLGAFMAWGFLDPAGPAPGQDRIAWSAPAPSRSSTR
ncbi:MAG: hypothetical protein MZV65_16065 [Chromatiales bacterium]|nr:hypothetical protein [Chromatiales bacterium]